VINNFGELGNEIVALLARYCSLDPEVIKDNQKLAVGYLLMEYLEPILHDLYFLERSMLPLLVELADTCSIDDVQSPISILFKLISTSFDSDTLKLLIQNLMQIVCRKLFEVKLYAETSDYYQIDNNFEAFARVVFAVLSNDRAKSAWLQSPYLFDDLEMMYSCHLMSQDEWKE
jgi:hypothetical protein